MASLGHIAVGMAAARVHRAGRPKEWSIVTSMVVWSFLSLLPDADVVGFRFGVAYSDALGHRGATHSIAFALALGALIGLGAKLFERDAVRTWIVASVVLLSHGFLDCLTDGGLGCALFWPLSDERFFAPWEPIPVAPLGRHFLSSAGLSVALTESALFAPFLIYALWPRRKG